MFSLSKESEYELTHGVLELVENYLEARDTATPRLTGLITAQEAMDELDIKYKTLQKWEDAGLRRYQPPLEDTRKIYYRVSDLLKFLGGGKWLDITHTQHKAEVIIMTLNCISTVANLWNSSKNKSY